jgi:hypothetical protein
MGVRGPLDGSPGRTRQRPEAETREGPAPMIWDAFANFWYGIFDWVLAKLPEEDPFDLATDGASWEIFTAMNYFLPVSELLSVFGAVFLMGGPMLIVTMVNWVAFGIVRGGSPRA